MQPLCGGMGNDIPSPSPQQNRVTTILARCVHGRPACADCVDEIERNQSNTPLAQQQRTQPPIAELVAHFHEWAFDEQFGEGTNSPEQRIKLHNAEHAELIEALEAETLREFDIVEYISRVALELADNAWLAYGSAHSLGIPLDAVIDIVYRSHLTRVNDDDSPAVDADNKVRKTRHYRSPLPEIRELIERILNERKRTS